MTLFKNRVASCVFRVPAVVKKVPSAEKNSCKSIVWCKKDERRASLVKILTLDVINITMYWR